MSRNARILVGLVIADVVLFMISGVPRYRDAKHGADLVIGQVVWIGFLIGTLALLALLAVTAARTLRSRRALS